MREVWGCWGKRNGRNKSDATRERVRELKVGEDGRMEGGRKVPQGEERRDGRMNKEVLWRGRKERFCEGDGGRSGGRRRNKRKKQRGRETRTLLGGKTRIKCSEKRLYCGI